MVFRYSALLIFLSCTSSAEAGTCPKAFSASGKSACILKKDALIAATIEVTGGTTLDCQGHKLTAANGSAEGGDLAIIVHDADGARVTNCTISGFEFGIFTARATHATIDHNTLDVKTKGIILHATTDSVVDDNTVRFTSGQGAGIGVWRSSHRNTLKNNDITGASTDNTDDLEMPRPYVNRVATTLSIFKGSGFQVGAASLDVGLLQFIAAGQLFQFNTDPLGVSDNVLQDNTVHLGARPGGNGIWLSAGNHRTKVTGNSVTAEADLTAAAGVFINPASNGMALYASTCSGNSSRLCLSNEDCDLLVAPGANGTCTAPGGTMQMVDLRGTEILIQNNTITGPGLSIGISDGSLGAKTLGNHVSGVAGNGIQLNTNAIVTASQVKNNVLDGNNFGVAFLTSQATPATSVTANDITNCAMAPLKAPADWSAQYELPGNFWGSCAAAPTGMLYDASPSATSVAGGAAPTACP